MKYSTCFVIEPSFTLLAKVLLVVAVLTILLYVIRITTRAYYTVVTPSDLSQQTGTPYFIREKSS
jgi:hypothetical protein